MKRIFALLAIIFIVSQTFFTSAALASVQPWSGNPWSGESWHGNPWEGDSWEGSPWEGNGTNGESWNGDGTTGSGTAGNGTTGNGTTGNGTTGNGTNGDGTSGDSWNGDGTTGNGTTGNGTTGNGTTGNGTTGDGTTGNRTTGDGTTGNGTTGNGTTGDGTAGNGTTGNGTTGNGGNGVEFEGPSASTLIDYIGNDLINGQISLMADAEGGASPGEVGRNSGFFLSGLFLNGLKLKYEGNPVLETASFINDSADKGYAAASAVNTYRNLDAASSVAANTARGAQGTAAATAATWGTMGALGKLNVIGAGAATVYGAYDTYNKASEAIGNWGDSSIETSTKVAETSDATASLGTTLMSAGVVAGAIPGGQGAAAVMIAGGAVLWGASKLTGAVARNWDGIKSGASKAAKAVGDTISNGWETVKGWF